MSMMEMVKTLRNLESEAFCAWMDSESWNWKKNVEEAEKALSDFRSANKFELIAAYGC